MAFPQFLKQASRSVRDTFSSSERKRWRWYHGAAWIIGANAAAFLLEGLVSWLVGNSPTLQIGSNAQREYFFELKQAVFAPPAWVFGPVWIANNILMVWAALRVLHKPLTTPGRKQFLVLQAASWGIFVSFNALFVGLLSPINAFVFTFGMWGLTVASIVVAAKKLQDSKVAWLLTPLLVWTTLASAVALCQALWNYDAFYAIGPFMQAPEWLLRS